MSDQDNPTHIQLPQVQKKWMWIALGVLALVVVGLFVFQLI